MAEGLTGRFIVLVDGQLQTYQRWEDLPLVIDEVVAFQPHYPQPPHTHEQHQALSRWDGRLRELMRRRRAASNPGR